MRIINVIVVKNGAVDEMESFGVFEEQCSSDVVEEAENAFKEKVLKIADADETEFEDNYGSMESYIEDGVFMSGRGSSVCLTWSEVN